MTAFTVIQVLDNGRGALLLTDPGAPCSRCGKATMIGFIPPLTIASDRVLVFCAGCDPRPVQAC
jgi:hypothetical protein